MEEYKKSVRGRNRKTKQENAKENVKKNTKKNAKENIGKTDRSKKKQGRIVERWVRKLPYSYREKIQRGLRQIERMKDEEIEQREIEFLVIATKYALLQAVILILITILAFVSIMQESESRTIQREEGEKVEQIIIFRDGEKETYDLRVYPREYTDAEFDELEQAAEQYLLSALPDGKKGEAVEEKIELPDADETGKLDILWESNQPTVLGTGGEVDPELEEEVTVILTATITDGIHEKEYEFELLVVPRTKNTSEAVRIRNELLRLEEQNRTKESFDIPDTIEGAGVHLEQRTKKKKMICTCFMMGVALIVVGWFLKGSRLMEKSERRKEELRREYYRFVKKLTLFLGAGMSMQRAVERAAIGCEALQPEVEICINEIHTGITEKTAYEKLGKNLMVSEYMKLFSIISQNLRYGNQNLLKLLTEELRETQKRNREEIRKNGEIISEKLMAPLLILLVTVIGIVAVPAMLQGGF